MLVDTGLIGGNLSSPDTALSERHIWEQSSQFCKEEIESIARKDPKVDIEKEGTPTNIANNIIDTVSHQLLVALRLWTQVN